MPRSYNGTPANADASGSSDWAVARSLVIDGENFNDATFVIGNLQPIYDRVAWLKLHGAFADLPNTFTASNTFQGSTTFSGAVTLNANAHVDNNSTLDVRSGSTAKIDSGGTLLAASGSNVTINSPGLGNVNITADTLAVLYTSSSNGLTLQSPLFRSGDHAVSYERSNTSITATGHIDCSQDRWRVADTLAGAITLQVDAPPQPTLFTRMLVSRSPGADSNQVTLQQGTGCTGAGSTDIGFGNEGSHPTFTEYDGSANGRWAIELLWSPSSTQWRVGPVSGAFAPAVGAA